MPPSAYKQAIVDSGAADIVYTDLFTGVHGNYLALVDRQRRPRPRQSRRHRSTAMKFGSEGSREVKAWRDIWGSGQGIGIIDRVRPAAELIDLLADQYAAAKARLCRTRANRRPRPRSSRPISARAGLCAHLGLDRALVDPLHPRVELDAGVDQPLAASGS